MICTESNDGEGPRTSTSNSSVTWFPADFPSTVCSLTSGQKSSLDETLGKTPFLEK